MKRLSFFALTSLVLAGTCFDVQASEQSLQKVVSKIHKRQDQIRKTVIDNSFEQFMFLCEKDAELTRLTNLLGQYNENALGEDIRNLFTENNDVITNALGEDLNRLFDENTVVPQLPFLKRHETVIKRAGAVIGGVATVAATAYAMKNPKAAKEELQKAGNKVAGSVLNLFRK